MKTDLNSPARAQTARAQIRPDYAGADWLFCPLYGWIPPCESCHSCKTDQLNRQMESDHGVLQDLRR